MSRKLFTLHSSLFITLFVLCSYGQPQQSDLRSQNIIDDMTAKFKTYASVSLDFKLEITHFRDNSKIEYEGKIWIKNNMFKLETSDFVMYFDGSKMYHFSPIDNEVYLSKPDPNDNYEDFQLMNPLTYFNFSSKNFRSRLSNETIRNNRSVYVIEMIPVDVLNARFSLIHLNVEKNTLQMTELKIIMKDGENYELSFKPYNIVPALRDSFFTFNPSEHPNVEVIDLTF